MWPLIKAPHRKRLKIWMGINHSRIIRLWSTNQQYRFIRTLSNFSYKPHKDIYFCILRYESSTSTSQELSSPIFQSLSVSHIHRHPLLKSHVQPALQSLILVFLILSPFWKKVMADKNINVYENYSLCCPRPIQHWVTNDNANQSHSALDNLTEVQFLHKRKRNSIPSLSQALTSSGR